MGKETDQNQQDRKEPSPQQKKWIQFCQQLQVDPLFPSNSSNLPLPSLFLLGVGQDAHEPTCQETSQDPTTSRESAGKKLCDALLQVPASGTHLSSDNNKDNNIVRCPCGVNEVIHVVMETSCMEI